MSKTDSGDRTILFSTDHKFKDSKNGLTGAKHTKRNQINIKQDQSLWSSPAQTEILILHFKKNYDHRMQTSNHYEPQKFLAQRIQI